MNRFFRFGFLVPFIFAIGVSQYGSSAIEAAASGNVVLWKVDESFSEGAGVFRYIKDGFLLFFSILWPIQLFGKSFPSQLVRFLNSYVVWVILVALFGLIGILLQYSPFFFAFSGFRWLMLLHCAVGVFVLSYYGADSGDSQKNILRMLFFFALIDLALTLWQLQAGISAFGIGIGKSRLTGMFSNAGIAGFFALSLAVIGFQLDGGSVKGRFLLVGIALLIALASGGRSMMMCIFLIFFLQIFELTERPGFGKWASFLKMLLVPLLFLVGWLGYQEMIEVVDRGGILENQLSGGGRISNFLANLEIFSRADLGEFLFGRGLGTGTNTLFGVLVASGIPPDIYRFNWLADNSFLTQFFQFGFLGSLVFWCGIVSFAFMARPRTGRKYLRRFQLVTGIFFLILWSGNPFEHYFLMLPFAIALALPYWSSVARARELKSDIAP